MADFAVIFDLDGTLVETVDLVPASYIALGRSVGADFSRVPWKGLSVADFLKGANAAAGTSLSAVQARPFIHDWTVAAVRRSGRRAHVRGIGRLLRRLRAAGVPFGIVTASPRTRALRILEASGLARHFPEGRVESCPDPLPDGTFRHVPKRELFLRLTASMGVAPSACVAFGDDPRDAFEAVAAGVGFPVGRRHRFATARDLRAAGAKEVISDFHRIHLDFFRRAVHS